MSCCRWLLTGAALALTAGCNNTPDVPVPDYYGTLEPFASEAVYFIVTDRFVDGDPDNNHESQGGSEFGTFDIPIQHPDGGSGNIGYLGGDFRGVLDNAGFPVTLDAGTDNGFTFTSPNWPTEPQSLIFKITNVYPTTPCRSKHPASRGTASGSPETGTPPEAAEKPCRSRRFPIAERPATTVTGASTFSKPMSTLCRRTSTSPD